MILYKYVSTEFLKDYIENSYLFCSDWEKLNDPFELKILNTRLGTYKNLDELRVLCLTNSFQNKLMWSHYADKHKGVCIAVEVPKDIIRPVCYTSSRVTTDKSIDEILLTNKFKPKKSCISTYDNLNSILKYGYIKDYKWMYEREYRAVFTENAVGNRIVAKENGLFFKVKIKRIYLGVNFDANKYKDILNICKQKEIPVVKMLLDEKTYAIKSSGIKTKKI